MKTTAWYQKAFERLLVDYQTRRGRAGNEVLAIQLDSGLQRITYLSVNRDGVAINGSGGLKLYAAWNKGDRFIKMYEAMGWVKLPEGTAPPVIRHSEWEAWEVKPPQAPRNR